MPTIIRHAFSKARFAVSSTSSAMSQNIERQQSEEIALKPFPQERWREFFEKFDTNRDGRVRVKDFLRELERDGRYVPRRIMEALKHKIQQADQNQDQIITFDEFYSMVKSKEGSKYQQLFQKYIHYTVAARVRDATDGEYEDEYSCSPPKLCMAIFSILEVASFLYDWFYDYGVAPKPTLGPLAQLFIYDPHRRKEAWRFASYMFVHMGLAHLLVNLSVQILLGVPLEMVHGNMRVLCIYVSGVVAGSLWTSISDPTVFLAGASGGVYALMTAHIATIIMNWSEMKFALYQLFVFACLIIVDVGSALYGRYSGDPAGRQIGYVAHFAGAVTGLLVGINVLRNLKVQSWEKKVWWASLIIFLVLMLSAVTINIALPSYFPYQNV